MTWVEFHDLFMGKYFPDTARHAKAHEFLELKQGTMIVMEYVARLMELTRYVDDYMATNMAKVRRFKNGLKLSIRCRIVGLRLQDMDSMVGTTLTIERDIEVLVARGRSVSLLLVQERSRGLLVHVGSKAAAIQARDISELPVRLGKWCATIASSPDISGGISP